MDEKEKDIIAQEAVSKLADGFSKECYKGKDRISQALGFVFEVSSEAMKIAAEQKRNELLKEK